MTKGAEVTIMFVMTAINKESAVMVITKSTLMIGCMIVAVVIMIVMVVGAVFQVQFRRCLVDKDQAGQQEHQCCWNLPEHPHRGSYSPKV
jgi:heme/copper-type cytochrome/quinol oxidase subunit 2